MPVTDDRLAYRRRGAAEALGVSEDTFDRLARRGEIRAIKIGASVCVSAEELRRFLKERELEGEPMP